jgi:hypothetical protein
MNCFLYCLFQLFSDLHIRVSEAGG